MTLPKFYKELRTDFHVGAAELVDADADVAGFVAMEADDLACDVVVPSEDLDVFAEGEACGGELDAVAAVGEHGMEEIHLRVGDDSELMASELVGICCFIGEEGMDFGKVDYLEACLFGYSYEDVVGDNWPFDSFSASVTPDMYFPLCCRKCFDALLKQEVADGLLFS